MFTGDPETIISIDPDGTAHYNSEGYVSVTSTAGYCQLTSGEVLLATGDYYGAPSTDNVIAIFPSDYVPDSSNFSFGDMMAAYPDMMRYINVGYDITRNMYGGYRPHDGARQILAPLVVEGYCGAPGNPMPTTPCCYMNCGNASPQYNIIIHEMGHSFSNSKAMLQLLWSDEGRFANSGFMECVASLPVIYLEAEIVDNGAAYGIFPGSFEYEYARNNREYFCAEPQSVLPEFEQLISDGEIEGVFNTGGLINEVQAFCSFFEAFSCPYIEGDNYYGHQMLRRFLHVFSDTELPAFIPEKVETYFAAAYSVAAGGDMREKLKFWGFAIDDAYYEQTVPGIQWVLREGLIFRDGFE